MFINHNKPNQNFNQNTCISKAIKLVHDVNFILQRSPIKATVVNMRTSLHIPPFSNDWKKFLSFEK